MIDISTYFLYKFQENLTKIKLFFHLCKAAFYMRLSLSIHKFKRSRGSLQTFSSWIEVSSLSPFTRTSTMAWFPAVHLKKPLICLLVHNVFYMIPGNLGYTSSHQITGKCWTHFHSELAKDLCNLHLCNDALPMQRRLGLSWDIETDQFTFHTCKDKKPFTV